MPTAHAPQYTIPYETTTSFNSSDGSVVKDTKSGTLFEVGSPLFYAVVGAGSGVSAVILCCLVCICTVLIYKHNKLKGEYTIYKAHACYQSFIHIKGLQ